MFDCFAHEVAEVQGAHVLLGEFKCLLFGHACCLEFLVEGRGCGGVLFRALCSVEQFAEGFK